MVKISAETNLKLQKFLTKTFGYVTQNFTQEFRAFQEHGIKNNLFNPSLDKNSLTIEVVSEFTFEYKLENGKTPIETILEQKPEFFNEDEFEVLEAWKTPIHSVFKVIERNKDSIKVYNLVNEKDYIVNCPEQECSKLSIGYNSFMFMRILPYQAFYFISSVPVILKSTAKLEVLELACKIQVEHPLEMVLDNPSKVNEIHEKNIALAKKFQDLFETSVLYTTGKNFEEVYDNTKSLLNFDDGDVEEIKKLLVEPKEFYISQGFLDHLEKDNPKDPEASFHIFEHCHDVGILCEPEKGLQVLPYFATFKKIFSDFDYHSIQGYKECVLLYLRNDNITHVPFKQVFELFKANAVSVLKDVLEKDDITEDNLSEVLEQYKYDYIHLHRPTFNDVNTYSASLNELTAILKDHHTVIENVDVYKNIGRNDICPCGSGKKYKKCCLVKVQAIKK